MDAALITCSSISEVVDIAQSFVKIPIFKIDEPMADKAVASGNRIGVAATLATTLEPTKRLILSRANKAGKAIDLEEALCNGAFEVLQNGEPQKHDEIVKDAVIGLLDRCDVVVLAQASMARVADQIPEAERKTPILSSPRLGVQRFKEVLDSLG